ncbi:MAG: helix-turn-helix domain-containing protein [Dehalococcoidia bacterium]
MTTETRTMSIEDAAKELGIGRQLAYDAVRRGEIPSIRIGRRVLIPREGFERMLAGSGTEVSA